MVTQSISLSKLKPSSRNARKTGGQSIAELAASIEAIGLLQNLTVIPVGKHFEVVAGGRRLAALQLLAREGKIDKGYEVNCQTVDEADAIEASTAENSIREAMHPADQFEAFKQLVDSGKGISTVAARFGVSELVVKQRLKLANVSPKLLMEYRAGNATLEQMQALAITDDHAAQEAAFSSASEYGRSPRSLRSVLTAQEISAEDPRVQFVGVEAYEAAGGVSRRDLFGNNVYISDAELLDKLVSEKLAFIADGIRKEGWAWVEVRPNLSANERDQFTQKARPTRRAFTAEEQAAYDALETRADELDEFIENAADAEQDSTNEEAERERISEEMHELAEARLVWSDKDKAKTGVVIYIDYDGLSIDRGLQRVKNDPKASNNSTGAGSNKGSSNGGGGETVAPKAAPQLSQRATEHLYGVRTGIIRNALLNNPKLALASLVSALSNRSMYSEPNGVVKVRAVNQGLTTHMAEGLAETAPEVEIENELATLLNFEQPQLIDMLVSLAARNAVANHEGTEYCRLAGINVADHWTVTEEWLAQQSKGYILAALAEIGVDTKGLEKLKSAEVAKRAATPLWHAGWLPEPFRQEPAGGES